MEPINKKVGGMQRVTSFFPKISSREHKSRVEIVEQEEKQAAAAAAAELAAQQAAAAELAAQQAAAAELAAQQVVRQSGRIGAGVNNKYNWTI